MSDYIDPPGLRAPPIPLHQLLGLTFAPPSADDATGVAEVNMPVRPEAYGSHGNLHGGAIATMIDLASALAAVRASAFDLSTQSLVTTDMHVRYLGQPRTDTVTARAEVVRAGAQLIVVEARVVDGGGHLIAVADLAMMIVPRRKPLAADRPAPS